MAKIALGMTMGFLCGVRCANMGRRTSLKQMKRRLMKRLKI